MDRVWVGIDVGEVFHWAHVLDASGKELLSRRSKNDEADVSKLIDEALSLAGEVIWAIDQPGGSAALLLGLLSERDQRVLYVPSLSVNRASDAYCGESKTDARVIADEARMRPDLGKLEPGEEEIAELRILLGRRRDLVVDHNRTITRLGEALLSLSPPLERALDSQQERSSYPSEPLPESTTTQASGAQAYLAAFLRSRGVKGFDSVAGKALAAKSQSISLPAEPVAARIVAELAAKTLILKDRIGLIDKLIKQRFYDRPEAEILASLPGMGQILGAEFFVCVGDIRAFESADHLAAYAGLVPGARDSGKRVRNRRRMREGNKTLIRVFY